MLASALLKYFCYFLELLGGVALLLLFWPGLCAAARHPHFRGPEVRHVVPVQEDAGGVHGDEGGDLLVAPGGALDDV